MHEDLLPRARGRPGDRVGVRAGAVVARRARVASVPACGGAEGTYWEARLRVKVLGNLAGAPSILLGRVRRFLLVGLYCVAGSQIFQVRTRSPRCMRVW